MMDAYGVDFWPLIVVDGRYLTSPARRPAPAASASTEAQQQQAALQVMDFLVAKAKAEKKMNATGAPLRVFITGASSGIGAALARAVCGAAAPRSACWPAAAKRCTR